MFCSKCGVQLQSTARFCPGCGESTSAFPAGESVDSSTASADHGAIWNPSAASNWSLLFSPVFGSYLHTLNWRALGEPRKASLSLIWFWVSIVLFLSLPFLSVLSLILHQETDPSAALGLLFLLVWYFAAGRGQSRYVKIRAIVIIGVAVGLNPCSLHVFAGFSISPMPLL